MDKSNVVFEKYVADYTEKFTGIQSDDWAMCTVANSTYTACPISDGTEEFVVTSYNPAAVDAEVQTFKVPPTSGSYDVSVFDMVTNSWTNAESTLLCYDFLENDADHSSYQDCNMHVKADAKAHHMTYMKVTASDKVKETAETTTNKISTSTTSLVYNGQSDCGCSQFSYTDANDKTYNFEFNL